MNSLSLLVILTLFFLISLSRATHSPLNSPPPPPPPSKVKPISPPSKAKPIKSPPPPPPPHSKVKPISPPSKTKPIRSPPPPPPPYSKVKPIRSPPPPPKGTSPVPPPPFSPPCKCSVKLKTLGACALVLRGIAVNFAERVCCKGLKSLSYSDVSSCICFVFRYNVGNSSKLKITVEEAKKVISVACNL